MTTRRWEYASVIWTSAARKITQTDPEYQKLSEEVHTRWAEHNWAFYWWIEQTFYIWLPGATEADTRRAWSTGDTETSAKLNDILNELGAEGWELVSNMLQSSGIGPSLGRDTAGFPTQTVTLLKRPLEAGNPA